MQARIIILLALNSQLFVNSEANREIMKAFSYTFGLKMFECGEKTHYTEAMAKDILHFWDITRSLNNTETGCLVICAMMKLELLNSEGELITPNAEGFAHANGADDNTVKFLIDLYNTCKNKTSAIMNGCKIGLELSKCFRRGIYQKNWIPDTSSLWKLRDNASL
ncbi:pheromone-binding protein-like isoform X2 [Nymphalis io]|nr:pheromone-binding protein-like isoform X2 [Nymphalis io]XP_050352711.1 pheromone-binding protein-like isoform X2 [Nymphalis io]XP_050352712.1 pheromone-binding protein-like isoform X2 [Nymphalis io]XP_050352713.1 pheromone-binding protein-like isoform X2 [Nymphalis io]XP_050352717.1 pheromone-binding protein-like isoform X2 [Nymphalis io]